jgi:hypothetical protein
MLPLRHSFVVHSLFWRNESFSVETLLYIFCIWCDVINLYIVHSGILVTLQCNCSAKVFKIILNWWCGTFRQAHLICDCIMLHVYACCVYAVCANNKSAVIRLSEIWIYLSLSAVLFIAAHAESSGSPVWNTNPQPIARGEESMKTGT